MKLLDYYTIYANLEDMEEVHPFKKIRWANGLTQNQLAEIADVTNQVVLRSEQGLYNIPSPKLTYAISKLELEALPVAELNSIYRSWQKIHRLYHRVKVQSPVDKWKLSGLIITMPEFRRVMGQPSVLGLCKLLCVHPSQIDRYTKRGGSLFFLQEALRDVLNEEDVQWVTKHLRPL